MSLRRAGILALLLVVCAVAIIVTRTTWAGTGTVVPGTPDYVNLNLYYTYAEPNPTIMRNAFQEASRLLYNSTNGQMQLGTIRVSTNSAFQNKADVWVNSGADGAYTAVAGLGTPGAHTTLFVNRHRWTAEDGPLGNERGQFGIVHEFGHYGFSLYDEYKYGATSAYCVSSGSSTCCIMDGGTTVHPQHHRTEWCTPTGGGLTTSHVTTPMTNQQAYNGCSCWQTIASYVSSAYGITLTTPATVVTTDPAGHSDIGWVTIGNRLRYVITLDRSYSMSVDNKEPLAKQGAALFTNLCYPDVGESLGVVSFSNTAVADFPIQEVTSSPDTRAQAVTAINAIALENMTALGDGLRTSLNQITGGGAVPADSSAVEAIVLLSDGVHNFGAESPSAVLPDLRARGVRVFTIGLGSPTHPTYPLDESTLLDISNQTGALYSHAPAAADLPGIYLTYAAEVRGMDTSPEMSGELSPGATKEHKILVDKFTDEQTFVLHWPYNPDALQLRLRRPDGVIVTPGPGVEYLARKHHIFYRVSKVQPGTWTMVVSAKGRPLTTLAAVQKPTAYKVQGIAHAPGLSCKAAPRQAFYQPGQVAQLRAFVSAGGIPVAKVSVTGKLRLPNGERVSLLLYDDGNMKEHGDDRADDGVYSARFTATRAPGTYQLELVISNRLGVTATPDEVDRGWKPRPVAPFVRMARCSFSVGRQAVKPPSTEKAQPPR